MAVTEKEILVRFVKWVKLKVRIHTSDEINFYFKEREIWWASLGANVGHEQDGKNENFERPVLVLKKFNKHMLWVLPLTSKNKAGKYYHQFEYEGELYSVILSQIRTISSKRLIRKSSVISKKDFEDTREKIKQFI